jgi:hypothetical protein
MLLSVPGDHLRDPPPALLWEIGLSPHPSSQALCLCQSLLGASGSSGRLACHPAPKFGSLPHSCSPGRFSIPLPPPQFTVYVCQFCLGRRGGAVFRLLRGLLLLWKIDGNLDYRNICFTNYISSMGSIFWRGTGRSCTFRPLHTDLFHNYSKPKSVIMPTLQS